MIEYIVCLNSDQCTWSLPLVSLSFDELVVPNSTCVSYEDETIQHSYVPVFSFYSTWPSMSVYIIKTTQ